MKAALFYEPRQPLKVEEVATPEIAPDEILVKVAGCGICQSDMEYIDLGVPTVKKPPIILGHETAGTVSEIGASVKGFNIGDPVLLGNIISCGNCRNCREGKDNICDNWLMLGNHIDGAYAEYIKVPARNAYLLPPEIPPEDGCIIADAVSTPFHAVKNRARLQPGDSVAVFGCGGLGMNCVQIAAAMGGDVIAVDFDIPVMPGASETKLQIARKLGASETIDAENNEVVKKMRSLTGGGCELALFCDMVIASEKSELGQPDIKLGNFAPLALAAYPFFIWRKKVYEFLFTGDSISAKEAERIGLVNMVVPEDKLKEAEESLLKKLLDLSSVSIRASKMAMAATFNEQFEKALDAVEATYLSELGPSEDGLEGLVAFLEKRPPVWKEK